MIKMAHWSKILEKIDDYSWRLPRSYKKGIQVDGIIFADDQLMEIIDQENAVEQVANVAFLPGITGNSLAMPDIHWGYGFPVGGVAATDCETGVISPGGIGFDINCGVRLMKTNLTRRDIKGKVESLIYSLFSHVPSGSGKTGKIHLSHKKELTKVLEKGAKWAVDQGYGWKEDLEHTEAKGCLKDADCQCSQYRSWSRTCKESGKVKTTGSNERITTEKWKSEQKRPSPPTEKRAMIIIYWTESKRE